VYRNGFLYTSRDTGYTDIAKAATSTTFDVIDTSNMTLASQSRLVNANTFYPAFDVPATVPPGQQFATTSMITGTTTAPDGTLAYPGMSGVKPGKDFYDLTGGTTAIPNRWGDYFGGAVDPVTGGLWTTGQYGETRRTNVAAGFAGMWGNWVGFFPWLTTQIFTDVPASGFSDYINVMSLWQITSGCTATTFCPTATITRSQFGVFLIRSMFGNPCPNNTACATGFTFNTTPYFTDVPATDAFFPYIQKLRDLGITTGCSATEFCPADLVPRSSAAVLLVRAKLKTLFGDNFTFSTSPSFADVAPTSFAYPYIQKLLELGITSGCSATEFCPNDPITRQQAAVFIVRSFLN